MADLPMQQRSDARTEERKKRLVVIADSDAVSRYFTSMVLQRLDYNIQTLKSPGDVLDLLNVARPALILTELLFPDMDGLEFIRSIKRNPRTYATPVIVLTASRDPGAREACLREACKDYLQKPVEPEVLYAAIQKVTETYPRRYIRLMTALSVMVGAGREGELSATQDWITALSEQGAFVNTPKPRPVGTRVPVVILMERERISTEGEVVYSFEHGKGPLSNSGMGIKFIRIAPADQERIRGFIRREITKDLSMEKQLKRGG